jgi:hypothetical protein
MQLHIKLSPGKDDDLIHALQSIPTGKRAERIRDVLTQGFVSGPDLAQAVHRLATAIERMPSLPQPQGQIPAEPQKTTNQPLLERAKTDHAFKAKLTASVLGGFDQS